LLNLANFLQGLDTIVKGSNDISEHLPWLVGVGRLIVLKSKVNLEERESLKGGTSITSLLGSLEHILDGVTVDHSAFMGQEGNNRVNISLNRLLGHVQKSILHDELGLSEESLELASLVDIVVSLEQVVGGLFAGGAVSKVGLDDLLDLVYPGFFKVVAVLGD